MTSLMDVLDGKGGGLGAALKSNLAANEKFVQESDVEMKAAAERAKERTAKVDAEEAKLDPNVLKPPVIDSYKAPPRTSPIEAFGSAAGVLAALGGLLTRQPLTTSLNAAAKVLDAYKRNDDRAAQDAFDEWRVNTDNAMKLAHFELDAYRAALSKIDSDRAGTFTEMNVLTKAMQNHTANSILVTQGLEAVQKYTHDMQMQADKVPELQLKLLELHTKKQGIAEIDREQAERANTPNPMTPEERINKVNRVLSGTPTSETPGTIEAEIVRDAEKQWPLDHNGERMPAGEKAKLLASMKGSAIGKETPFSRAYSALDEETMRTYGRHPTSDEVAKLNAEVARGESAAVKARRDKDTERKDLDSEVHRRVQEGTLTLKEKIALDNKEVANEKIALMRDGLDEKRAEAQALINYRNRQEDRLDKELQVHRDRAENDKVFHSDEVAQQARGHTITDSHNKAMEAAKNREIEVREKLSGAKRDEAIKKTDNLIQQADDLIGMIDANPNIVGTRGLIGGAVQTVKGIIDPRASVNESYQRFETSLKAFRTEASLAISSSKYYSGARMTEMAKTLPALERFTSAQDAKAALSEMKGLLMGGRLEVGEPTTTDLGTITQADIETTARENGMPVDAVKRILRDRGFTVP